jgi:two-component system phosphate regulon sensor histidine kinase PhoR
MLRSGLFWKMFSASVALILLTALVTGWIASGRVIDDVERETKQALRTHLELIHGYVTKELPQATTPAFQEQIRSLGKSSAMRLTIIDASGVVLADSSKDPHGMDNHGERPEVLASRDLDFGHSTRRSDTMALSMVYVAKCIRDGDRIRGYVRGAVPLRNLKERLSGLRHSVAMAALIAVLVSLIAAVILARRLSRPLRAMTRAAAAIAAGDLDGRVATTTADEVGELGRAFNEMTIRLQKEMNTIRRDRRELRAILGGMAEGVVAIDWNQRIVLLNESACEIFGVDSEASAGLPIADVLRVPQVPGTLVKAMESGCVQTSEWRSSHEGRQRILRLHASPLIGGSGGSRGAVLVLDDVTERRRAGQVRSEFIANASHELKTPVASIRGLAETILHDPDMDLKTRDGFLERVIRQSTRLGSLVEEMLALARAESKEARLAATPFDARAPLQEVVDDAAPLAAERSIHLDSSLGNDPLPMRSQREALVRIAGNLIDNAIRHSDGGETVRVQLERRGAEAWLAVSDNGPGIPADRKDRIFERFYRLDDGRDRGSGGTGLGLAIVKHLVQAIGGHIEVLSPPEGGSRFVVRLPLA